MSDEFLQRTIADILRTEAPIPDDNVCVANCDRLARKIIKELGMTEFQSADVRWWSTDYYTVEDK